MQAVGVDALQHEIAPARLTAFQHPHDGCGLRRQRQLSQAELIGSARHIGPAGSERAQAEQRQQKDGHHAASKAQSTEHLKAP